ncbi:MAG: UPF0280 family protein [Elusimicrobia bacterium CG08_land_8_20_14_0_20_44_26]|nr:MAG: UPF0280 family protein [Elusimicrobia bacterium CG08_land_8_20_14_0_20_44_26]
MAGFIGIGNNHFYRTRGREKYSFTASFKNANIFVKSDIDIEDEFSKALNQIYSVVENYASDNPFFSKSFLPLEEDSSAPDIIKKMYRASRLAGVGPMASVAGAIAEELYNNFAGKRGFLIIENGGDIFLGSPNAVFCGLYTGSSFDGFGLKIKKKIMPCGISSSSSEIGHSMSFGKAKIATVISKSGAEADAFATALANKIESENSLQKATSVCASFRGVIGAIGILKDKIAFAGDIDFVQLS